MNNSFGPIYADTYDLLYQDKDYGAECDLIGHILKTHGDGAVRRILDLGCGTGNHAIRLAEQGYEVVGVERSERMLANARRKAAGLTGGNNPIFHQGDIRNLDLQEVFDAVLMMFAVLGYQLENADVLAALRAARHHLRLGGLLIFDVWYGPAVLHLRPSQKSKVIPTSGGQILRVASGKLDIRRHLCKVNFQVRHVEGERLIAETEESHTVRYFFPMEIDLFLECSGFALIRLSDFLDFDQDPSEITWNALGLARAV